eukprot:TRINITY_DN10999_c0_g1_i1.p1 TRINITY_DN10999_c0_g1~~TRINITY_DN10999_c0_g1_i1.p1  ORF type:complete len:271 (+),score=61.53 TRINITY_DN10999_c0_g1_i1:54-866(+)
MDSTIATTTRVIRKLNLPDQRLVRGFEVIFHRCIAEEKTEQIITAEDADEISNIISQVIKTVKKNITVDGKDYPIGDATAKQQEAVQFAPMDQELLRVVENSRIELDNLLWEIAESRKAVKSRLVRLLKASEAEQRRIHSVEPLNEEIDCFVSEPPLQLQDLQHRQSEADQSSFEDNLVASEFSKFLGQLKERRKSSKLLLQRSQRISMAAQTPLIDGDIPAMSNATLSQQSDSSSASSTTKQTRRSKRTQSEEDVSKHQRMIKKLRPRS